MNVLSLFDGMSCGKLALARAGVEVGNYYASEIDKHAITVSKHNHPDIIHLGDVSKWCEWDLDWGSIDLLIGGSPCQGFSLPGKKLAFDDPRSKLFFEYVKILHHIRNHNPDVKFLLENVKMKREHLQIMTAYMDVEPVMINSSKFVAQNRERYYWANFEIPIPKGGEYALRDYLQPDEDVPEKFWLSEKAIAYMNRMASTKIRWDYHKNPLDGNAACLTASMYKGVPYGVMREKLRRLTPLECERLQTVPENYTAIVSDTQRYKMLGNGWTVDVIAYIFNQMPKLEAKNEE